MWVWLPLVLYVLCDGVWYEMYVHSAFSVSCPDQVFAIGNHFCCIGNIILIGLNAK